MPIIFLLLLALFYPFSSYSQTPSFAVKVMRDAFAGFDSGFASGVVFSFSKNLVITNHHAVMSDQHPLHIQLTLSDNKKRTLSAKVIFSDNLLDLSVLEVPGLSLLGQKEPSWNCQPDPQTTISYVAFGNPFNQDLQSYHVFFSGYRNFQKETSFVLNPALPPGFSGSALINQTTNQIEGLIYKTSGSVDQNFFTYAIPSSDICDILSHSFTQHPLSKIVISDDFRIIQSSRSDFQINDEIISINQKNYTSVLDLYKKTRFTNPLSVLIKRNETLLNLSINPSETESFWADRDVLFSSSGCLLQVNPQSVWPTLGWKPGYCFTLFKTYQITESLSMVYSLETKSKTFNLKTPPYSLKEIHHE